MRYVFDPNECIAVELDNKIVVIVEPEDESDAAYANYVLSKAFNCGDKRLQDKAAAAIAMSSSLVNAAGWLQECELSHIPGDCPLCGAT